MNSAVRNHLATGMITLASGMLFGCFPEDDFQDLEVMAPSPKISLPLLNTNLTLSNLINTGTDGSHLVENNDQSYSLKYKSSVASPTVSEFFPEIPNQSFSKSFSMGYNAPGLYSDSITTSFQGDIPLELNDLTIYKIEAKQGMLNLNMASSYEHDVKVTLTFPNIVDKQGNALKRVFDLKSWIKYPLSEPVNLSDYTIKVKKNMLTYDMEVTIYGGTGNAISASQEIMFDFGIEDIAFSYLEGNFADIVIPVDADTLFIPAFQSAVSGDMALQPILSMDFHNSFGTNIRADLSHIFVRSRNGQFTKLADKGNNQFFGGNFQITSPANKEEPASTQRKIDKSTSNIEEAFSSLPDGMLYDMKFALGGSVNDTSFVSDNSKISVDIETEIPLEGRFEMMMADTMDVDFQDFSENVDELKVLIKTVNGFPIDAYLQIYFLDEEGHILTDAGGQPIPLFKDVSSGQEGARFLQAAIITDTEKGTVQPEETDMPIAASISDRHILEKTKHLLIQAKVHSTDKANSIKLYSFYNIRFSMAMQMKASL